MLKVIQFVTASLICITSFTRAEVNVLDANALPSTKTLFILADEWCPYNCVSTSDKPGYMIEIAKAILEPKGYQVKYDTMTWTRALNVVRIGRAHAVVGALKNDAPHFTFPTQPMGIAQNSIIVRKNSPFEYDNITSLKNFRLGIIQDYSYGHDLDQYIAQHKHDLSRIEILSGVNPLERNLQMLLKKRVDAVIEDFSVLQYHLQNHPDKHKFKILTFMSKDPIYIAFSPNKRHSSQLSLLLDNGLTQLRQSGELSKILAKYNLLDWVTLPKKNNTN